ncbi:MAG: SCO family protein [Planctomycetota bacterium]
MGNLTRGIAWMVLAIACLAITDSVCAGEGYDSVSNTLPKAMEGVGIDEKLGQVIPIDLPFRDQRGVQTSLAEVLKADKPVILTLNYSDCPGLCIAQLNGVLRGVNEVSSLQLGTDFYLVSVSIDPQESTAKAAATQTRYSQDLFDQHDPKGWQFWTGSKESIAKLTDAVGFRYTYDAIHKQYNHPTAAIFLAPSGKITRYLYELGFNGNTFKMAAVEAGEGRVGSSMDMIALWCVHYNPMENRYSASARQILSLAAGVFVSLGLVASIPFWLARRGRIPGETVSSATGDGSCETIGHATPTPLPDTINSEH